MKVIACICCDEVLEDVHARSVRLCPTCFHSMGRPDGLPGELRAFCSFYKHRRWVNMSEAVPRATFTNRGD